MEQIQKPEARSPWSRGPAETTGVLKIFFGYAAGVGKTYAMLEAAHQAQKEGIDVVAGYIEPHARPDTLALLEGLETLPPAAINYRGIRLREFDLDLALQRKPQLILVDELAHTNARGSRHTKRYQDVEELLRAGIHVYTTVNVQHLESLHDLVSSITGIEVSERIPDRIFDRADQVELVDIEPDELMKRLQAGKVYRERQAKQALSNFFTADNLRALREIAMRRTADQLNHAAVQEGNGISARAGEHILICLSSAPSNTRVIRTAARMAEAFHSGFTALFVQTPETKELSGENLSRLRSNLHLAEQLGAQIATVYGTDPAVQIAEYARVSGVTKIVMGRINHKQAFPFGKKSLADRLIELTDLDVYIIPDHQPRYKKPHGTPHPPKFRFTWNDTGVMLGTLLLSTGMGFLFHSAGFSESNIITVYILGVLLTAVWTSGYFYGALASFLSVAAFNFFFTEPRFSFQTDDSSYPVTFLIMLFSSIMANSLATRVKEQARLAVEKSYYTELLLESSQKLQQSQAELDCLRMTAEQLSRLFDRPVLYALSRGDAELSFRAEPPEASPLLSQLGLEELGVFTTVTTSFTTGTINNMHDTLTPLGGLVPLLHMMLNCVFGGKGVGLMNIILYAILAVFICGLMVGRTPEYLGKKIEGREMKLTALAIIIHPLLILAFSALAVATSAGQAGITNPGFHGLTQVLYEYASSAANNGSGFEGLADNTYFWNITTGLVMFLGRYLPIVLQLAIAGSLMKKSYVNESAGTLQTSTVSFSVILVFVVYIFAALTFFPALALGPIAEHLTLWG